MQSETSIDFYLRAAMAHARTLPLCDSVKYLRGLLELAGDQQAVAEVRHAFVFLRDSDAQLELISSGQIKLALTPSKSTKP